MSETPLLGLPIMEASQAQKHVTHNEALLLLDAAIHLSVVSRAIAVPPPAAIDGDRYLVAAAPTGVWAGQAGKLAVRQGGAWRFSAPRTGWRSWVADEQVFLAFDGSAWQNVSGGSVSTLPLLGINATADTSNRLSVSSPGVLLNHAGTDQRLKINKNAAANTGSLLFQTNFSGRAEMGLAGDDDFHFKVSADGTIWNEALVIDRSTGAVTLPKSSFGDAYATRPALAAAIAGGLTRANGVTAWAAGLAYRWQAGATELPALPGLVPAGTRTFSHYGAAGNGIADDTAAVNAARGIAARIDGEGRIYGVTGTITLLVQTHWHDLTLKQLAPAASQSVITLLANGVSNLTLKNVTVDRNGSGLNSGTNARPNAALATARGMSFTGGTGHRFEDLEVFGNDSGTGILFNGLDESSIVIRPKVRDIFAVVAGVTDDVVQGISFELCTGLRVIDPSAARLGWKNAAVDAVTYNNSRGIVFSGCSKLTVSNARAAFMNQGIDFTGNLGSGNSDIVLISPAVSDIGYWGIKAANWVRRLTVLNGVAERVTVGGFVDSASFATDVTDADANRYIDCAALDCGTNSGVTSFGFGKLAGAYAFAVPVKAVNFRAHDRRGMPLMPAGVYNEVANRANARFEAIDCFSIGHVQSPSLGFTDLPGRDLANAIGNAGFEWGGTGWHAETGWSIEIDAANAASGHWAAKNTDVTGVARTIQSNSLLPVVAGDSVHAEMWLKTSATPTITDFRCRITWLDKDGAIVSDSNAAAVTTQQLSYIVNTVTGVAPVNAVAARFKVYVIKTVGTVWIDRARMTRLRDAVQTLLDGTVSSGHLGTDITVPGKALLTAATAAVQRTLLNSGSWTDFVAALGGAAGVADFEMTVTDAACGTGSVIELRLAATAGADENEPEFVLLNAMTAQPGSGSFALTLAFAERHSGPLKLQYRIN